MTMVFCVSLQWPRGCESESILCNTRAEVGEAVPEHTGPSASVRQ